MKRILSCLDILNCLLTMLSVSEERTEEGKREQREE